MKYEPECPQCGPICDYHRIVTLTEHRSFKTGSKASKTVPRGHVVSTEIYCNWCHAQSRFVYKGEGLA